MQPGKGLESQKIGCALPARVKRAQWEHYGDYSDDEARLPPLRAASLSAHEFLQPDPEQCRGIDQPESRRSSKMFGDGIRRAVPRHREDQPLSQAEKRGRAPECAQEQPRALLMAESNHRRAGSR